VANTEIGKAVEMSVLRDGSVRSLKVTVGNMTDARQASAAGSRAAASRVADRLGVELQQADKGVVVTDVKPESPADQAGIAEGDIIREVNRTRVERMEDLEKALSREGGNGKQVLLRVERGGSERYVVVEVG
jgi:serine protease Do